MNTVQELFKKSDSLRIEWIKNFAGISIAALTVLISIMPDNPPSSPEKYFLIACWVLLAICIPLSLASSYQPVIEAKWLAFAGIDLSQKPNEAGEIPGSENTKKYHKLNKWFLMSQFISILLLCLSFFSLTIYACLSIL